MSSSFRTILFSQVADPSQGMESQAPVSPHVANAARPPATSPAGQPAVQPTSSVRKFPGRNEQQLNYLLERQKEFKQAALQSKKQGDLEGAKNYLRMSKVRKSFNQFALCTMYFLREKSSTGT